ncbi:hypothetical protein [Pseudogulbenkiania sp. NH8B]|uniref:hypothetical protein n=1 Tax=Pseudogulbenkiania sp. (strain NH8B) TaxID=748280 RepID=UPI0002FF2654|nr:hypothetical protein [Pseudogulbenkiania sp. NH8B]
MNWKSLIAELLKAGMTQKQIADEVGCTQPCIAGLATGRRGKQVSYDIGSKLVALSERMKHAKSD